MHLVAKGRRWASRLGVVLACSLVAAAAAGQASRAATLRLAYQNPETGWGAVHALKPWVAKVEEVTKGRVKVQVFYSETLAKGQDSWNAVTSGVADLSWNVHMYWPGMTPLADVMMLPLLPHRTGERSSEVMWQLYEQFPALRAQFQNAHVLFLYTSAPFFLITRTKPVRTLEDLRGLRLRVAGGPPTEFFRRAGALPVLFPMPDAYLALERGTIDGMAANWEPIHSFRLYEVVRYYTIVPLYVVYFSVAANRRSWESLPLEDREAISAVAGLEGARFWGRNFEDTAAAEVANLVRQGGYRMETYTLPEGELRRWQQLARPLWDEWVTRMERSGYSDARRMLETALELLARP